MLAGHDEAGGELILKGGQLYKSFYGMASEKAMIKVLFFDEILIMFSK